MKINLTGKEPSGRDTILFSHHGWIAAIDWLQIQESGKNRWKHSVSMSCYVECTIKGTEHLIIMCKSRLPYPLCESNLWWSHIHVYTYQRYCHCCYLVRLRSIHLHTATGILHARCNRSEFWTRNWRALATLRASSAYPPWRCILPYSEIWNLWNIYGIGFFQGPPSE